MPYILNENNRRGRLRCHIDKPQNAGELNYVITTLLQKYIDKPSYTVYNEVIGVLECCKLEIYRRAVAAYEDKKIEENGDVYVTEK